MMTICFIVVCVMCIAYVCIARDVRDNATCVDATRAYYVTCDYETRVRFREYNAHMRTRS